MKGTKPHLIVDNSGVKRAPAAPSWLSDEAKAEWRRVVPVLVQRQILTVADLGGLENYCIAIGLVRQMEAKIQIEGAVIDSGNGARKNPAVAIQADAINRARLLAAELGLTPVSRSRPSIRTEEDNGDSDLGF
ncbi:phage terminase small subunit P27 family [Methylobrevis pamukkalensis]|uniref:Phage terminase, small subunit n=1 Tax=Methylobrevis pamukkalensis TaxID=1439726 RepID=A0A1E3GXT3_9HYPH|nr:phage terminase small subunit P27 family [Methylobrevis pamukkalensis]ODN68843.1 Phage terminase, small subunit [Methylobrevis pamukkalensis]